MDSREELEQSYGRLREVNEALVAEIRALRESVENTYQQYHRTRRRFLLFALLALYGIPVLGCGGLWVWRQVQPREENEAERITRQHQEQLDQAGQNLDRAEKLLRRWEKVAPKQ